MTTLERFKAELERQLEKGNEANVKYCRLNIAQLENKVHIYQCPHCGWVVKSPTLFDQKKPCLNCDGFMELQAEELQT